MIFNLLISNLTKELKNLIKSSQILIFTRLFIFLLFQNFLGLFPYIFTSSTHLVFGLALGLPLWLGHIIFSYSKQPLFMLAHLTPLGTPRALQPFIVLIEVIRNIIRPLTLRVRLIANIIAGHLLLTLLGLIRNRGYRVLFLVLILITLIILLELGVAIIQAYVFTLLRRLYISEVNTIVLNKN